jgi:hypothetical protein
VPEFLSAEPWVIVVCMGMLIPIVAIIINGITGYLHRSRQAELDASLKHEMLQRGMSAEEIRTVIEASSRGKRRRHGDSDERREAHESADS